MLGTDEEVLRRKTVNTECVDLQGKTVMPGFIDAHGNFLINVLASQVFVDVSCAPSGKATIYRDAEGNP